MPARTLRTHLAALCTLFTTALAGCGASSSNEHTVTILAAASLTESITDIAAAYEADHPGARVRTAFAGSQILAAQILEGARFDLFCSADDNQMDRVGGFTNAPIPFATSRLVVITPASTTAVDAAGALAGAERIALAAPEVPAGRYARAALEQLGLWDAARPKALSLEDSVRGVLTRVVMGEADAGVVYATDTDSTHAGTIRVFELPGSVTVRAHFLAATGSAPPNPAGADDFLTYLVTDASAQAILRAHGFDTP